MERRIYFEQDPEYTRVFASRGQDFYQDRVAYFVSKINPNMRKGLEVGCGTGVYARYYRKYPHLSITPTDFSESVLADASRRYPEIKFEKADIENLPYPDQSFDFVVAFDMIHFIEDP